MPADVSRREFISSDVGASATGSQCSSETIDDFNYPEVATRTVIIERMPSIFKLSPPLPGSFDVALFIDRTAYLLFEAGRAPNIEWLRRSWRPA